MLRRREIREHFRPGEFHIFAHRTNHRSVECRDLLFGNQQFQYFLRASSDKDTEDREKIPVQLRTSPMNRTELAKALGMKGISRKLSAAVEQLIAEGKVVQIVVGGGVKLAAGE